MALVSLLYLSYHNIICVRSVTSFDLVAGIAQLTHLPLGAPRCCGVLEIFPQSEWTPARGYGNMARKMGFYYDRLDFIPASKTSPSTVPVSLLRSKIELMLEKLNLQSSCILPNVLDDPLLRKNVSIIWS